MRHDMPYSHFKSLNLCKCPQFEKLSYYTDQVSRYADLTVLFVYSLYFVCWFNLLNPTGYVMHQQFNIQQMYVLPTLYLCVLYLSENKQQLVPLTA